MLKRLYPTILILLSVLIGCGRNLDETATVPAPHINDTTLTYYNKENISSATLGRDLTFQYFLPPHYTQGDSSTYPVLYLIPGGGGTTSTWFEIMGADVTAQQLIDNGDIPPFIIVSVAAFPMTSMAKR